MSRRRRQRLLVIAAAILLVTVVLAWQHWRANAVPRWLERHDEETLLPLIDEVSARHGVAPALVRALVWKESRSHSWVNTHTPGTQRYNDKGYQTTTGE